MSKEKNTNADKITKFDIVNLFNVIENEKSKGSVKFRYLLLKNKAVIKSEIDALAEVQKSIKKIIEPYLKEHDELIKKIGVFNDSKKCYEIPPTKVEEYNTKIKPITDKYKKIIDEHDKKFEEYQEILKEKIVSPLNFVEIKLGDIPQEIKVESIELFMKLGILK